MLKLNPIFYAYSLQSIARAFDQLFSRLNFSACFAASVDYCLVLGSATSFHYFFRSRFHPPVPKSQVSFFSPKIEENLFFNLSVLYFMGY